MLAFLNKNNISVCLYETCSVNPQAAKLATLLTAQWGRWLCACSQPAQVEGEKMPVPVVGRFFLGTLKTEHNL